jgi:hypothetical protein
MKHNSYANLSIIRGSGKKTGKNLTFTGDSEGKHEISENSNTKTEILLFEQQHFLGLKFHIFSLFFSVIFFSSAVSTIVDLGFSTHSIRQGKHNKFSIGPLYVQTIFSTLSARCH